LDVAHAVLDGVHAVARFPHASHMQHRSTFEISEYNSGNVQKKIDETLKNKRLKHLRKRLKNI
jgi:hypothetical protein